MDQAPTISREEHSSYCSAQSGAAPLLSEISRDMKQNSEDARVSSARAPRQASCFAEYRVLKIIKSTYIFTVIFPYPF